MSRAVITFPILGEGFALDFLPYLNVFGLRVHWYGIIIAAGFLLAVLYSFRRCAQFGISGDDIVDMLIWAVPLAIICARLYYVIFYRAEDGSRPYFDGTNDLSEIIAVWRGGLAIYGGVIGGALGLVISTTIKKINTRAMLDVGGLGMLIGQAVGRWGNFANREAYGAQTDVAWRMGLTTAMGTAYYHPTFLYESLWNALGFLILHFCSKKRRFDGQIFVMYIGWYGLGRMFIEGLRTDSLYLGGTGIRVSQLIAALTFAAALAVLVTALARRPSADELWVHRKARLAPAGPVQDAPGPEAELIDEQSEQSEQSEQTPDASVPNGDGQ